MISKYTEEQFKEITKRLKGDFDKRIEISFTPINDNHWIKNMMNPKKL